MADETGHTGSSGKRVAVLPFRAPDSHRLERYLGAGIGEDILDKLDGVPGLVMAARASAWEFRDADPSGGALKKKLGVEAAVTGTAYKDNGNVKVEAKLSRTEDGQVLWTQAYERPMADLFKIIAHICQEVARTLDVEIGTLRKPITNNVEAFEFFLQGLDHSRDFGNVATGLALDMHQMAVQKDPEFALAYAGIAEASTELYLGGERNELNKKNALEASAKAVELMPQHSRPHIARGCALFIIGESEEGMKSLEKAIELDPESFDAHYAYARECFSRGQPDKALKLFKRAAEIRPDDYQTPMLMSLIYEAQEQKDKAELVRRRALELAKEAMRRHSYDVRALYMGANALVALGEKEEGLQWADRAETIDDNDPMLLYNLGCIHALADDQEKALDLLERAVEKGYSDHGWMSQDDDLEPLRTSGRFQSLLGKMGA